MHNNKLAPVLLHSTAYEQWQKIQAHMHNGWSAGVLLHSTAYERWQEHMNSGKRCEFVSKRDNKLAGVFLHGTAYEQWQKIQAHMHSDWSAGMLLYSSASAVAQA
eukprot:1160964-Pelagomonas_calceolata.AAC.2